MPALRLLNNLRTLAAHPAMLPRWLRWQARRVGWEPVVRLDARTALGGFSSFGQFWSSPTLAPSDAERRFVERHLPAGGTILDVGANIGVFSALLARARPGASVQAFEPLPVSFERLRLNVARNGLSNVTCHALAAGARSGRAGFVADPRSPATNRLASPAGDGREVNEVNVEVTTLDEFCDRQGIDAVAFLKIDVEGFEADVLRGAASLFARGAVRLGLVEICPGNLAALGRTVGDLYRQAAEVGCTFRVIEDDGRIGEPLALETAGSADLMNAALVPDRFAD